MSETELLWEGVNLMIVGMGFVLIFLFLLIFAISLISKIVNTYFPENLPKPVVAKATPSIPENNDIDRLRPVIVAAIAHHRRQQGLH